MLIQAGLTVYANEKLYTLVAHSRQRVLSLGLLTATFVAAFFPVWDKLVRHWMQSEDYSHGFLIVPLSIYIGWTKHEDLARLDLNRSWTGLGLAALALLLYIFSYISEINTAMSLSMVLFIAGAVLYSLGWQALNTLKFPLFLLLLMIPIPAQIYTQLTVPLQLIVSQISALAAKLFAVPIFTGRQCPAPAGPDVGRRAGLQRSPFVDIAGQHYGPGLRLLYPAHHFDARHPALFKPAGGHAGQHRARLADRGRLALFRFRSYGRSNT